MSPIFICLAQYKLSNPLCSVTNTYVNLTSSVNKFGHSTFTMMKLFWQTKRVFKPKLNHMWQKFINTNVRMQNIPYCKCMKCTKVEVRMTILVNLSIRNTIKKATTLTWIYHMTLDAMFNLVVGHMIKIDRRRKRNINHIKAHIHTIIVVVFVNCIVLSNHIELYASHPESNGNPSCLKAKRNGCFSMTSTYPLYRSSTY